MTKFKKSLSVLLVFVLCFAVCGVIASAADTPTVMVYTSYANNEASQVRLTIKTSKAYAAIVGSFKYGSGLTLVDEKIVFAEETSDTKYKDTNNTVKFALVTDNFGDNGKYGDQYWVSFLFDINNKNDISFTEFNAQVADFEATQAIDPDEYKVASVKTISTVGSLGSQYRDENPALRFGAKLERKVDGSYIQDSNTRKAISCGAVVGFKFNIKINDADMTDADLANFANHFELNNKAVVVKDGEVTGAKVYQSTKYFYKTDDYLTYTFAITGLGEPHKTYGDLQDKEIVFMPYTIYQDGDTYGVVFGDAIAQSYTTVNEIYNFVKG